MHTSESGDTKIRRNWS